MTAAWRAPAASTQDWRRDTAERELGVEQMIRLGSEEYGQTDWALLQLRLVTGRCETELVERIDELLALADEIADAERQMGQHARWHAAVDEYEAKLFALARLSSDPSDLTALVDAVQEPAPSVPLTLVRER